MSYIFYFLSKFRKVLEGPDCVVWSRDAGREWLWPSRPGSFHSTWPSTWRRRREALWTLWGQSCPWCNPRVGPRRTGCSGCTRIWSCWGFAGTRTASGRRLALDIRRGANNLCPSIRQCFSQSGIDHYKIGKPKPRGKSLCRQTLFRIAIFDLPAVSKTAFLQ